jgi:putative SOS response-associated peptidase YedK
MCYNAAYDANRAFKKAIRDELNPEVRAELERKYEAWREQNPDIYREKHESQHASGRFFTSAFEHDAFPIIYSEQGQKTMDFFRWGLVPRWCRAEDKALQIWTQTINARSETMFEKPSFRASSLDRRCVVYMTGFFEYHHQGSKKYPFFIRDRNSDILLVAGLWDSAIIDGQEWKTFTIVTVPANETMAAIHNNPKNPHRMPLILRPEQVDEWISPTLPEDKLTIDRLKSDFIQPYPDDGLEYTSVGQLLGKHGIGDKKEAQDRVFYPDLKLQIERNS